MASGPLVIAFEEFFNRLTYQARVSVGESPIDIKTTFVINGKDTSDAFRARQHNAILQHLRACQIELELMRGEHNSHVPNTFFHDRRLRRSAWFAKLLQVQ